MTRSTYILLAATLALSVLSLGVGAADASL